MNVTTSYMSTIATPMSTTSSSDRCVSWTVMSLASWLLRIPNLRIGPEAFVVDDMVMVSFRVVVVVGLAS